MTAPDLLPCPFCGGDDIQDWGESTWSRPVKWMYCTECQSHGPRVMLERNEEETAWLQRAIAAWNTRATPAATTPEVRAAAARDVLAERARQVSAEGWTPEHDDTHFDGAIARAAASYALSSAGYPHRGLDVWPWSDEWWKPTTRRADLVKAGALILAEIERIDRAALRAGGDA